MYIIVIIEALTAYSFLHKTIDIINSSTVFINTICYENKNMTIVLSCCTDGSKLKQLIIFKRKTMQKQNFSKSHCNTRWKQLDEPKCYGAVVWRSLVETERYSSIGFNENPHEWEREKAAEKNGGKVGSYPRRLQLLDISDKCFFKSKIYEEWEN